MIKRFIYITGIMVMGLWSTGCSEEDDLDTNASAGEYILFGRPWIDPDATVGDFALRDSRATLAESVDEFDVWGFCVPRSVSNASQLNQVAAPFEWNRKSKYFTAGADVFDKTRVKIDGSFTDYQASGIRLKTWNADSEARYTFVGTSVTGGIFTMAAANASDSYGPRLTFTLPATGSSLTSPLDYTAQPDALIATTIDHQRADGRVPMSFAHIMIGLRFKFHNHTDDKDLVVRRVTFAGEFYKETVIDFTDDNPNFTVTSSTYTGVFTLLSNSQLISPGSADMMGGDTYPVTLLLLPNRHPVLNPNQGEDKELILGNRKTISITYTIGDGPEKTYELRNFELNYIPQENSLHTAHFNFVGDEFVVIFQANNDTQWGNGSDSDVDIK